MTSIATVVVSTTDVKTISHVSVFVFVFVFIVRSSDPYKAGY